MELRPALLSGKEQSSYYSVLEVLKRVSTSKHHIFLLCFKNCTIDAKFIVQPYITSSITEWPIKNKAHKTHFLNEVLTEINIFDQLQNAPYLYTTLTTALQMLNLFFSLRAEGLSGKEEQSPYTSFSEVLKEVSTSKHPIFLHCFRNCTIQAKFIIYPYTEQQIFKEQSSYFEVLTEICIFVQCQNIPYFYTSLKIELNMLILIFIPILFESILFLIEFK